MDRQALQHALLAWYDSHARSFPWRGSRDPYRIWVSEVMLQQTRTETVLRYYGPFLERFPDLHHLAAASEEEVLKAWEGLGYYRSARALHAGSREIEARFGGIMPGSRDALMEVRGIGGYTSAAIASIAYGERVSAVDGNALRVFSRLEGVKEYVDTAEGMRRMQRIGDMLVSPHRPGDFNQAIMDLGSSLCGRGMPSCRDCPVRDYCVSADDPGAASLPAHRPKKAALEEEWAVIVCVDGQGRLAVKKRTEEMLHGLYVLPMVPGKGRSLWEVLGEARHVFTHRVWHMTVVRVPWPEAADADWHFASAGELDKLPVPSAMRVPLALAREEMEKAIRKTGMAGETEN